MKKLIVAAGLALLAAAPASAGGIAVCLGSNEGRDGLTDFNAYTLAQSSEASVTGEALRTQAERQFRSSYDGGQRVRCRDYEGSGHYVVVRAAQGLNGRVLQLIGFGFGDTREAALAASRHQLDEYPDYQMFLGRGGELEVIDEGSVSS